MCKLNIGALQVWTFLQYASFSANSWSTLCIKSVAKLLQSPRSFGSGLQSLVHKKGNGEISCMLYLPAIVVFSQHEPFANLAFHCSSNCFKWGKKSRLSTGDIGMFLTQKCFNIHDSFFPKSPIFNWGEKKIIKKHFQNETGIIVGIIVVILKLTGGKHFAQRVLWVSQLNRKTLTYTDQVNDNFLAPCIMYIYVHNVHKNPNSSYTALRTGTVLG